MKPKPASPKLCLHWFGIALITGALLSGVISPVYGQNFSMNYGGFVRAADNAKVSASQAGNLAKSKYGGKVLKISTRKSDKGVVYIVRILLDSGKVINVRVDGNSGAVSK